MKKMLTWFAIPVLALAIGCGEGPPTEESAPDADIGHQSTHEIITNVIESELTAPSMVESVTVEEDILVTQVYAVIRGNQYGAYVPLGVILGVASALGTTDVIISSYTTMREFFELNRPGQEVIREAPVFNDDDGNKRLILYAVKLSPLVGG